MAAIIRKDEHYFNYKKETITKSEKIQRKAEEIFEDELLSDEQNSDIQDNSYKIDLSKIQDMSNSSRMKLIFNIEDKALNYLSTKYGFIEKEVRFKKRNEQIEFDGIITNKKQKINKIFEIKWSRSPQTVYPLAMESIRRAEEQIEKHEKITEFSTEFHLIIILNTKTSISSERINRIIEKGKEKNIIVEFYSLSEIGFEVTHEIN